MQLRALGSCLPCKDLVCLLNWILPLINIPGACREMLLDEGEKAMFLKSSSLLNLEVFWIRGEEGQRKRNILLIS